MTRLVHDREPSEAVGLPVAVVALDRASYVVPICPGGPDPGDHVGMEEDRGERVDVVRQPAPQDEPLGLESHSADCLDL